MDKKLLGLGILFMIVFVAYMLITIFRIPIFSQAANGNSEADIGTSLIFAWPLELETAKQERSEITVFVRDRNGKGIPEKEVNITTTVGDVQANQTITDSQGKAVFYLTSTSNGVAEIEAFVDNRKLQKTISVRFK